VWINDVIPRYSAAGSFDLQNRHGRLMLHVGNDAYDAPPTRWSWWPRLVSSTDSDSPAFQRHWWHRLGFVYRNEKYKYRIRDDWPRRRTPPPAIHHDVYLGVPLWFVVIVPGATLALWVRRRQSRRRQRGRGFDVVAAQGRAT
jgi:hypothetical protein